MTATTSRPSRPDVCGRSPRRMQCRKCPDRCLSGSVPGHDGAGDVALPDLKVVLAEGRRLVVGVGLDAAVEDPDALDDVEVVEGDAAVAADDDELAHLVGIRPAHVDVADEAAGVAERDEADVLPAVAQDARAHGADPGRGVVEQVVEDRDVVRRQVPERVDVRAERTEVRAARVHVVQVAERAVVHQRLHAADAAVVEERVAGQEDPVDLLRELDELVGLGDVDGERLLHQHVLAELQRPARDLAMRRGLCADHGRLDRVVVECLLDAGRELDVGEATCHLVEPARALVADDRHARVGELAEHAHVVHAPVTAPDHCDVRLVVHDRQPRLVHLLGSSRIRRRCVTRSAATPACRSRHRVTCRHLGAATGM